MCGSVDRNLSLNSSLIVNSSFELASTSVSDCMRVCMAAMLESVDEVDMWFWSRPSRIAAIDV